MVVCVVREYHGSYYVPHNLCLIVAGKLSTKTLLETIQARVEPSIAKHGHANGPRPTGWKRPFMETPSAEKFSFSEDKKATIEFPEKDESVGEVQIGFIGPPPTEFLTMKVTYLGGLPLPATVNNPIGDRNTGRISDWLPCFASQQGIHRDTLATLVRLLPLHLLLTCSLASVR